jgi:hypothetical protein
LNRTDNLVEGVLTRYANIGVSDVLINAASGAFVSRFFTYPMLSNSGVSITGSSLRPDSVVIRGNAAVLERSLTAPFGQTPQYNNNKPLNPTTTLGRPDNTNDSRR